VSLNKNIIIKGLCQIHLTLLISFQQDPVSHSFLFIRVCSHKYHLWDSLFIVSNSRSCEITPWPSITDMLILENMISKWFWELLAISSNWFPLSARVIFPSWLAKIICMMCCMNLSSSVRGCACYIKPSFYFYEFFGGLQILQHPLMFMSTMFLFWGK